MNRQLSDYLAKIPPLNSNLPKFTAFLSVVLQPIVDIQNLIAEMPALFDLDQAIGAQLDVCGQWIGESRILVIPIPAPWFAFDDPIHGLDKAPWYIPGVGAGTTFTSLDDETYRRLLYTKRAANYWDGTAAGAKAALQQFFTDDQSIVFVVDNCNMSTTIGISGVVPPIVDLYVLANGIVPLHPQGIRQEIVVTSVTGTPIFGFDVQNEFIGGWDIGSFGVAPLDAIGIPSQPTIGLYEFGDYFSAWFSNLPTTMPMSIGTWWNDGGIPVMTDASGAPFSDFPSVKFGASFFFWSNSVPALFSPPSAPGSWYFDNGGVLVATAFDSATTAAVQAASSGLMFDFNAAMTLWFLSLPTVKPGVQGVLYNNSGTIARS